MTQSSRRSARFKLEGTRGCTPPLYITGFYFIKINLRTGRFVESELNFKGSRISANFHYSSKSLGGLSEYRDNFLRTITKGVWKLNESCVGLGFYVNYQVLFSLSCLLYKCRNTYHYKFCYFHTNNY